MKHLFTLLALMAISCSAKQDQAFEFIEGSLEDISEELFALEKNENTQFIYITQTIENDGKTYLISNYDNRLQFYDSENGKLIKEVQFAKEGPNSLKGGMSAVLALGMDTVVAASNTGHFGLFVGEKKVKEMKFTTPTEGLYRAAGKHGNMRKLGQDKFQFGMFPMGAFKGDAPVGFKDWYMTVDLKNEEQKAMQFSAPGGYDELLSQDAMAASLVMAFDSQNNRTLVTFPYSDSLMVFEDDMLVQKVQLPTNQKFNYLPHEKLVTERFTAFRPQKDGSMQVNFLYDPYRDIFIRLMKIKESGDEEEYWERLHHYAINIYNPSFELLAEYTFDFNAGTQFSDYFITERGLFINASEQESDDFYQFYHINLEKAIGGI